MPPANAFHNDDGEGHDHHGESDDDHRQGDHHDIAPSDHDDGWPDATEATVRTGDTVCRHNDDHLAGSYDDEFNNLIDRAVEYYDCAGCATYQHDISYHDDPARRSPSARRQRSVSLRFRRSASCSRTRSRHLPVVTGTLTMSDVNGNVVSSQPLVYRPGTTVDLLYPGTSVNPDGSIDDVPGWILTDDGLWIRDPSDAFLRDGINLTYTVNPTATAFVTYPPESSTCANPDGPFPPPGAPPPADHSWVAADTMIVFLMLIGWALVVYAVVHHFVLQVVDWFARRLPIVKGNDGWTKV